MTVLRPASLITFAVTVIIIWISYSLSLPAPLSSTTASTDDKSPFLAYFKHTPDYLTEAMASLAKVSQKVSIMKGIVVSNSENPLSQQRLGNNFNKSNATWRWDTAVAERMKDINNTNRQPADERTSCYMTIRSKGRLGNQMFQYAALFATAHSYRCSAVLTGRSTFDRLRRAFNTSLSLPLVDFTLRSSTKVKVRAVAEEALEKLSRLPPGNLTLKGYFQSYKFFDDVKQDIRHEFTFPAEVQRQVFAYYRHVTPSQWRSTSFVRVGIHVRRTDLLSEHWQRNGWLAPTASYYRHAMRYFKTKYNRVQFIVTSDDVAWCRRHIVDPHVAYPCHDYVFDLAVLSLSDHVITSMGTYSWWAGWLCEGTTVYYDVVPPRDSYMAQICLNNSWIPPPEDEYNHWIPIK